MKEETQEEVRMAYYLPKVVEEAVRLHHPEVFIGDMIQEGNIGLMLALEDLEVGLSLEEYEKRSGRKKMKKRFWNRYVPECWHRWSRRQK